MRTGPVYPRARRDPHVSTRLPAVCALFAIASFVACGDDGGGFHDASTIDAPDHDANDTLAPETTITAAPDDPSTESTVSFEFEADSDATFQCRVDSETFAS